MSKTQHKKKKRKPNYSRISIFLICGLAILICCVSIGAAVVQQLKKTEYYELGSESLLPEESEERVLSDEPDTEEKESLSEPLTEQEEMIQEADWQTVPAGSVMEVSDIDFEQLDLYFVAYEIPEHIFDIINGKSYRENPDVSPESLRYMKVLHYNFEHKIQVGELIVSAELENDFLNIFKELFEEEYEIQSMYLVDNYWTGDPTTTDSASIDVNNTSAFLYRPATGSSKLSKHAYGRAIDINPQQNPYVSYRSGEAVWDHKNAEDYIDRSTGLPHMITHEDICYQIFTKYGFIWGGDWEYIKDYQHFEK